MSCKEPEDVGNDTIEMLLKNASDRADSLQRERDELLDLLRTIVDGDVGRNTLWKLSCGQGTGTLEGKTWLAAKAAIDSADSLPHRRMQFSIPR